MKYQVQILEQSLNQSLNQSMRESLQQSFQMIDKINSKLDNFTRKEVEHDSEIKRLVEENTALKSSKKRIIKLRINNLKN